MYNKIHAKTLNTLQFHQQCNIIQNNNNMTAILHTAYLLKTFQVQLSLDTTFELSER